MNELDTELARLVVVDSVSDSVSSPGLKIGGGGISPGGRSEIGLGTSVIVVSEDV